MPGAAVVFYFKLKSRPKELFCDIRALLSVLGVPVRADLLGVLGGQHGTAHHHLAIQLGGVEGRNGLLHALKGCGHQGGEAHKVDVLFPDSLHYGLHGNIAAQVDDLKAIVFKDNLDNVLADVVDIALDGGQHTWSVRNVPLA